MIKKNFMTGLVLLLPMVLTIIIVVFFVNVLTKPFVGIVKNILAYYDLLHKPFLFLSGDQVLLLTSKILALLVIICATIAIGFLGRLFIVRYFFRLGDYVIHRIPLVNKLYKSIQDALHTLFTSESKAFSKVVLVPFPHKNAMSIGLITRECLPEGSDYHHADLISIFVPGTPNPTMGFMLQFKPEQIIFLNMSVEDAFKFVVSCGVMFSGFTIQENPIVPKDISAK